MIMRIILKIGLARSMPNFIYITQDLILARSMPNFIYITQKIKLFYLARGSTKP